MDKFYLVPGAAAKPAPDTGLTTELPSSFRPPLGLFFHSTEADFTALRSRKAGEPNPLVLGTEKFNSVYLEKFRNRYKEMLKLIL